MNIFLFARALNLYVVKYVNGFLIVCFWISGCPSLWQLLVTTSLLSHSPVPFMPLHCLPLLFHLWFSRTRKHVLEQAEVEWKQDLGLAGVQLHCVLFSTGDRRPLWGVCGEQTPSSYVPALSSAAHDTACPSSPRHRPHHVWCCHPQWPVPRTGSVFRGHSLVVLSIVILLTRNHSVLSLALFGLTGESHSVMSDSLRPRGLKPMRLPCPWKFPGQDTGMGSRTLCQEIFPTQGSNPGLLHCRQILYHLSYREDTFTVHIQGHLLFSYSIPNFGKLHAMSDTNNGWPSNMWKFPFQSKERFVETSEKSLLI